MLDGDEVFFSPLPRHEAVLLLPELPSALETVFQPGDGSGGMVIRIELFPESDSGTVRLIGDDPAALAELWDEVRSAGGMGLPRIDPRSYGDLNLKVIPANPVLMGGQPEPGIDYSYRFSNGQLTEARAIGLGVDLVLEVIAQDKYRCETVERLSVLDAMGGPTN
jgi:hypothetical protein